MYKPRLAISMPTISQHLTTWARHGTVQPLSRGLVKEPRVEASLMTSVWNFSTLQTSSDLFPTKENTLNILRDNVCTLGSDSQVPRLQLPTKSICNRPSYPLPQVIIPMRYTLCLFGLCPARKQIRPPGTCHQVLPAGQATHVRVREYVV